MGKGLTGVLIFTIIFALLFSAPLRAQDNAAPAMNQAEAQKLAAQVSEAGSDKSLQSSATIAMQALIKFGEKDLTGAATGAYNAYGKFKNAENLDRLKKQNLLTKASMGSAEQLNLTEQEVAFLQTSTSFRRLSPEFFGSAENAAIAAEFEKKTGIRRQDFLEMLASAAENKLYVSDPRLAEKVEAEFEGFLKKIPNASFRASVKDSMSVVPSLTRHKLLVQAVQKMVQVAGQFGSGENTSEKEALVIANLTAAANRQPAAAADEAIPAATSLNPPRSLNSDEIAKVQGGQVGGALKLDSVVSDAIRFDADKETIFQIVSRRYRLLTPALLPPASSP